MNEEFDDHQDVARSGYADMLNDHERNKLYNVAIEISVASLVQSIEHNPHGDRHFKCCDIGTGSGLLAMMIARAFKSHNYKNFQVFAFEAFNPMATCAQRVIEANGYSEFITVMPMRSDNFGDDIQFDLLVAELLDTELIGEGCLEVYRDAVQRLCSPTCLFVPHQARIYVEPVASSLLFQRFCIDDFDVYLDPFKKVSVKVPEAVKNCPGYTAVDDMQASALKEDVDFIRFTKPKLAFSFTFNDQDSLFPTHTNVLSFQVDKKITEPPVIIMWWDIVMYDQVLTKHPGQEDYGSKYLLLSCAPSWARSESIKSRDQEMKLRYNRDVWREHWIQGVYYFKEVAKTKKLVNADEITELIVHCYHDTHSLSFGLTPVSEVTSQLNACTCGQHRVLSRSQLAFLSNNVHMKKLLRSVLHSSRSSVLNIQADLKFQRPLRPNEVERVGQEVNWSIVMPHSIEDVFDIGFQEDFSWGRMLFWLYKNCPMDPVESFLIKCTQVQFDNLNRIRTEVKNCEGFDMTHLDEMIMRSSEQVDKETELHYLWEHPAKRLDVDYTIYSSLIHKTEPFTMHRIGEKFWRNLRLPVTKGAGDWQKGWALVFWVEFKLKNTNEIFSTGPIEDSPTDEYIVWNRYCRQLIYFMHDYPLDKQPVDIDVSLKDIHLVVQRAIDYNTKLKASSSKLNGG